MASAPFRIGPVALSNTYTTNIFNPPTITGGVNAGFYTKTRAVLRKIRVANKGASSATFRLFIGATGANAAGTEYAYDVSVAVGSYVDLWCMLPMLTSDFLVGGASAATTLTLTGEGEIELSQ